MVLVRFGLFLWVVFRDALLFERINTRFEGQSYPFPAGRDSWSADEPDKEYSPSRTRICPSA
jgi:hypothetical protein